MVLVLRTYESSCYLYILRKIIQKHVYEISNKNHKLIVVVLKVDLERTSHVVEYIIIIIIIILK